MSRRPRETARVFQHALYMEKAVSLELAKALQVQIELNEALQSRIEELEKK